MVRLTLCCILLLLAAGCSTSSSVVVGKTRPAISPEMVKVYNTPPAEYEEVAIVDANSKQSMEFSEQGKMDAAIARLKEEAAKVGANGILINTIGDKVGGGISLGFGTGSYSGGSGGSVGVGTSSNTTYKVISAVAIYVIRESLPDEDSGTMQESDPEQ